MAERKSNQLYIRVDDDFKNKVARTVKALGTQQATFIRDAIERRMKELAKRYPGIENGAK